MALSIASLISVAEYYLILAANLRRLVLNCISDLSGVFSQKMKNYLKTIS